MKISEEQLEKGTSLIAKFMKLSRRSQSDRFLDLEDEVSSYSLAELKSGYINNYSYLMGVVDKIVNLKFDLLSSPSISITSGFTRISFDDILFTGEGDDIRTSIWLSVTKFLEYYNQLKTIDTSILISDADISRVHLNVNSEKLLIYSDDTDEIILGNGNPKNILIVSNKKVDKPIQGKCYITDCNNQKLSNKVVMYLCAAPNAIDCSRVQIMGNDFIVPNSFFVGSREVIKTSDEVLGVGGMDYQMISDLVVKINNELVEIDFIK